MIALDTSVLVAAFASWHEAHASALRLLDRRPRVPAHVLVETYSVLTRLPPPHRSPAGLVATFLAEAFTEPPLVLPPRSHLRLIERAAELEIAGGGIHDALIAAAVLHGRGRLFTRDRRALPIYERIGVDYELLD